MKPDRTLKHASDKEIVLVIASFCVVTLLVVGFIVWIT